MQSRVGPFSILSYPRSEFLSKPGPQIYFVKILLKPFPQDLLGFFFPECWAGTSDVPLLSCFQRAAAVCCHSPQPDTAQGDWAPCSPSGMAQICSGDLQVFPLGSSPVHFWCFPSLSYWTSQQCRHRATWFCCSSAKRFVSKAVESLSFLESSVSSDVRQCALGTLNKEKTAQLFNFTKIVTKKRWVEKAGEILLIMAINYD